MILTREFENSCRVSASVRYVVILISVATVIGALAAVGREYGVALLYREDPFMRYLRLSDDNAGTDIALPLSRPGTTELLLSCASIQTGLIYRLQTREFQRGVDRTCAELAGRIRTAAPLVGGAHAVEALSLDSMSDRAQAIRQSAALAPLSPWQVQVRLRVGLELAAAGAAGLDEIMLADIETAAQSRPGRAFLAQLYTQTPAYRALIVAGVERSPVASQRAFIQEVSNRGPISN